MTKHPFGWLLLPAVALVLLAAHLFHGGAAVPAAVALSLIALLTVRRWWAARLVQAVLALATLEWLRTTYVLSQVRLAHGQPYVRLVAILVGVAVFATVAAAVFQRATLRDWYGLGRPERSPAPVAPD